MSSESPMANVQMCVCTVVGHFLSTIETVVHTEPECGPPRGTSYRTWNSPTVPDEVVLHLNHGVGGGAPWMVSS